MTNDNEPDIPNFEAVETRADLVKFLDQLAELSTTSKWWENKSLSTAGYVHDLDGAYLNRGEVFNEKQNYKLIAGIFWAATAYE